MTARMRVEHIDSMGDDLTVVNDARVSFDKRSEWENCGLITPDGGVLLEQRRLADRDVRLIDYLARHGHWSPFSQVELKLRLHAPLFVARQMWKSHVGATGGDAGYPAWNEVSRRYVDVEPEFYEPEVWRGRAANAKQGSAGAVEIDWTTRADLHMHARRSVEAYDSLLRHGVAPEQARMVLPQSMMTSWVWKGSLHFFARVCALRDAEDAQGESRELARMIGEHAARVAPVSWAALRRRRRPLTVDAVMAALDVIDDQEPGAEFRAAMLREALERLGGEG